MPRVVILKDIPKATVDQVVSDFESSGARVQTIPQDAGRFTIIATFPDTGSNIKPSIQPKSMAIESAGRITESSSGIASTFIQQARIHLDKPYIWGSDGPDAFDCSGLVQTLLAKIGLDPDGDQTAHDLYRWFARPENGRFIVGDAGLGTLAFFGKRLRIGHVGMCLDKDSMIEAGGGGPETTSIEIAKKQGAKVRISKIARRSDLVALIAPIGLPW